MNTRSKAIYGGFVETVGPYLRKYTGYISSSIFTKKISVLNFNVEISAYKAIVFDKNYCILDLRKNQDKK